MLGEGNSGIFYYTSTHAHTHRRCSRLVQFFLKTTVRSTPTLAHQSLSMNFVFIVALVECHMSCTQSEFIAMHIGFLYRRVLHPFICLITLKWTMECIECFGVCENYPLSEGILTFELFNTQLLYHRCTKWTMFYFCILCVLTMQ